MQTNEMLSALTADIVTAFVSKQTLAADAVPGLITSVYSTLSGLGAPAPTAGEPAPVPAVSARASVKPDHVTCMCCGAKMQMLKRHLMTHHGLTPEEYRAKWGLQDNHPLVAPNYAAKRADLAKASGLGRKPGKLR